MSRVEPNRNVYVGHRYVPKIFGEWNKQNNYEGLSIVTYQGASYTSKKRVPVGIDISNEEFWVITGNYNAQVDHYRQETENMKTEVTGRILDINNRIDKHFIEVESNNDDDTETLINAFNKANELNTSVLLLSDKYYIKNNQAGDVNITLSKIKGNNAIFELDRNIYFKYDRSVYIEDLYIISKELYSTSEVNQTLITPLNLNENIDEITLKNVKFTCQTDDLSGEMRGNTLIRCYANRVKLNDLVIINSRSGLIIDNMSTVSVDIDNVLFKNTQTGIYMKGSSPGDHGNVFIENVNVNNISLINTLEQSTKYYRINGSDMLMFEKVKNVNIENIYSIYPCERAVYLNVVENVNISNVTLKHSDGVKVVGYIDFPSNTHNVSKNVTINNLQAYDCLNGTTLTFYDIENVKVDNVFVDNDINYASFTAILIERLCDNITITNVNGKNTKWGVIRFVTRDYGIYYNKFSNITLKDISFTNPTTIKDYYAIGVVVVPSLTDEYIFKNIEFNNVNIINNLKDDVDSVLNDVYHSKALTRGLVDINKIDGLKMIDTKLQGYSLIDTGLYIGENTKNVTLQGEYEVLNPMTSLSNNLHLSYDSEVYITRYDIDRKGYVKNYVKPINTTKENTVNLNDSKSGKYEFKSSLNFENSFNLGDIKNGIIEVQTLDGDYFKGAIKNKVITEISKQGNIDSENLQNVISIYFATDDLMVRNRINGNVILEGTLIYNTI